MMQNDLRPKGTYDLEALEELVASLREASLQGQPLSLRADGMSRRCVHWA